MLKTVEFLCRVEGYMPPVYELAVLKQCKDKNSPTGKRYYIEFKYYDEVRDGLKSKQIRVSYTKYPTKAAAKEYARPVMNKINQMLLEGYYKPANPNLSVSIPILIAIERYFKFAKQSYKTTKDYRLMFGSDGIFMNYAKKYWKGRSLNRVHKRDILEMLDIMQHERKWSNATRNSRMYRISGLFEFFKEREYITVNPVRGIKKLKISTNHYRPFVGKQISDLKEAMRLTHPTLYLFISFMYYTIARPNELLNARISHIDLSNNKFHIPNETSKNQKGSYVDIPPKLSRIIIEFGIMKYPSSNYIFGKGLGEPNEKGTTYNLVRAEHFNYLCRFGLQKTHKLYSWKVTGFCEFFRQKKDIKALCKQARHHDLNTTDTYLSYYDLYHHDLVDFE